MDKSFLGKGWGFPLEFDPVLKAVRMVSEEEDIAESLRILFATRTGERVMQPTYGCGLHALVFETVNERLVSDIQEAIEHAILFFESRVHLERVSVDAHRSNEGLLLIDVDYSVRSTNTRNNIVYPFYFREGTDVRL
jgi:phage baseplate assembly protein W